jgi:putative hydrolase of the HAD superfamily
MPLLPRLVALLVACLLVVGCRVDATVEVDVADDGSGTVGVIVVADAEAAALGGLDAAGLQTDDLAAAGWTVTPPVTLDDGSVRLEVEKPFASAEELPAVLAEVSDAFDQMTLESDRSFGAVTWTLRGDIDLSSGPAVLGDEQLAALLGGQALGRDIAALEQQIGTSVADATSLTFVVDMPGDNRNEWAATLGQAPIPIEAEGEVTNDRARAFAIVALVAGGLLLLWILLGLSGMRRRRGRARRSREAAQRSGRRAAPEIAAVEVAPKRLQLVVVRAEGVLWEPPGASERWLADLVAMQGSGASLDQIRAVVNEAKLGRVRSADVWRALGAAGDPAELDAAYAARFTLDPAVVDLVTALARRGVGVACISDDVGEWSVLLRRRFGLERFIRPWILSSAVGVRSPSPALLQALNSETGIAAANCLMVDADLAMLDAARAHGMSTALLGPDAAVAEAHGHAHAADLADLVARRADGAAQSSA